MRKLAAAALALLAAACTAEKGDEPLEYGAPAQPTADEVSAAATAETRLESTFVTVDFVAADDPSLGAPGLAEELIAHLGGYTAGKIAPAAEVAKLGASAVSQAIETGGLDPACVDMTATSVTWTDCEVTMPGTDPTTGATGSMTVTVKGTLTWNPATRTTEWHIDETMTMTETQGGSTTLSVSMSAGLDGSVTVTDSTIKGSSTTEMSVHQSMMGFSVSEGFRTSMTLDLGYVADPFCVTSGTMALEQRWTERPMGTTDATLPDEGWRFVWTGCNQFAVAHGS